MESRGKWDTIQIKGAIEEDLSREPGIHLSRLKEVGCELYLGKETNLDRDSIPFIIKSPNRDKHLVFLSLI